ncbi:MAG: hypothetical protein P1U80_10720 [Pseudomonadales bacterium]|nr:hypothetical protein [Pseudomonadales bacterium]
MRKLNKGSLALICSILLSACGGGGSGGGGTSTTSTSLKGVAAAGAAIVGTVTVKGSLDNTKSALIEADGSYDVDVTGLTAPYRLRAVGTVGGKTYKLHSYAEASDLGNTVNITPFTDLIIANAAGQIAAAYFDEATPTDLDPAEIDDQEAALQVKLQSVFDAVGVGAAINLLNSTFSADHSGLDAALDIIRIEQTSSNIVTITNLIESTTISDDILDADDNSDVLEVTDTTAINGAVTDTQAIVAIFDALTAAFANGLPTQASIENYFAADFSDEDSSKGLWLTDITTDPNIVGLSFGNIVVSELDTTMGTATVTVYFSIDGVVDPEPATWFVAKDATLGWQIRGDQRIVDTYFSFHCNDYDGDAGYPGECGINTQFWDEDFTNNGTGGAPIASGTVSIIDGSDGVTIKDVIYLGTPSGTAPGDVQVYNEATGGYQGDYKAFGSGLGEIASSIFATGDIIQYDLYTEALDITTTTTPQIASAATAVASYRDTLLFAPSEVLKIPSATTATKSAMAAFEPGDSLTIAWTLQDGTRNDEILIQVSDTLGNRIEIWQETWGSSDTSITVASAALNAAAATSAGLDANATSYELRVRVYAQDTSTGQSHSRDYTAQIPGPAATGGGGSGTTLACNYESGWDDANDQPATFNSYTDFLAVVADCGGALTIVDADIIGSWVDSDTDAGVVYAETVVLNADYTMAWNATEDGVIIESGSGTWSLTNNIVILEDGVGRQALVVTASGMKAYSEDSNWTPPSDLVFDGTADGEIWTDYSVKQ